MSRETSLDDYADDFQCVKFERNDGVLEMILHTRGGSVRWGPDVHQQLERAFLAVGSDPQTKVVILGGEGTS